MKTILMLAVASLLLISTAVADDAIDLSTIGKKKVVVSDLETVVIKYTPMAANVDLDAVDVRVLGRSFGTFETMPLMETMLLSGPAPITYTPSFSISVSNVTSSRTIVYTPPIAVGNLTLATPTIMISQTLGSVS
ncbi:MAG: hypothetical protein D4Q77_00295 [Methanothrix sp.]|nr:MAG: hypothetical protein D4Q77_00295 [Methanothrix sp.]